MIDQQKLAAAAEAAYRMEQNTSVPAGLVLSQWALESGWGENSPEGNCFGIKEYPGCYGRQLLKTTEWFTKQELSRFLSGKLGRTAVLDPNSTITTAQGRQKYICQDFFATFPSLEACFEKRAQLFSSAPYKGFLDTYRADGDLESFIKKTAAVYATAPDYAKVILEIIGQNNVTVALSEARSTPEGSVEV